MFLLARVGRLALQNQLHQQSLSANREVPAKTEEPAKEEPAVKTAASLSFFLKPPPTEAGIGEHPNLEESSPNGLSSIPTRITRKEKHAIAHGGCSVEELNQLRNQIAFIWRLDESPFDG